MTDRPIIFSGPMIRALMDGRKTVTRRILKPQPGPQLRESPFVTSGIEDTHGREVRVRYRPGDRLWVREAHCITAQPWDDLPGTAVYRADRELPLAWRPSIHMPRWASRLTLHVTGVKVERLQDISEEDAIAEGVCAFVEAQDQPGAWTNVNPADRAGLVQALYGTNKRAFQHLWDTINGADSWDANPWVVAVSFSVHRGNIDALAQRRAA